MDYLPKPTRIAVVGNYIPRRCGIATFTADLCEAIAAEFHDATCFAVPVNDVPEGYDYPPRVRFELAEQDIDSYQRVAEFLNINEVDVVSLQHEYGIFGGAAGSHILELLRQLRIPVVSTLHTVLKQPTEMQRKVLNEIVTLSDRVVVMAERGAEFLREVYGVPGEKIDVIPHGIPDVPFVDPSFYKDQFGLEGKTVLFTFGLLSPNKGIENVIEALPAILSRFPNVVYVITGATHPHIVRDHGEAYRDSLYELAERLGVRSNVLFYNEFVELDQLLAFIGAADIYVTPYVSAAQISSGALAYSVGAGKAVISTPYWYAEELLAEGRGILVPFRDPAAIAREVTRLLENTTERDAMRKRAYLLGRGMIWPRAARAYLQSFARAREERMEHPRIVCVSCREAKMLDRSQLSLSRLDHLQAMTDDTGILQHAVYSVPNYDEGYATDDNARALILTVLLEKYGAEAGQAAGPLATRYLAFLWHAFNPEAGRFRNFLSFNRRWAEQIGSEDSHGRALWALGIVLGSSSRPELRGTAARLYHQALPEALEFRSPRAVAYSLLGIEDYLNQYSGDKAAQYAQRVLAERLLAFWMRASAPGWQWFEDVLAYANARLPQALMIAGHSLGNPQMFDAGLKALDWLAVLELSPEGYFVPIGSLGYYHRGGSRARFDQQPIEAATMVSACLTAHRITRDPRWLEESNRAFDWFLGRNDLGLPLYDPATGGCRDALQPDRVNQNQGAESSTGFLTALTELRLYAREEEQRELEAA